ncbi:MULTISPECIES: PAN domain-containing protein [Sinorhizobium]|nr:MULTISPECIES: PAN domain-containing protein [Sinorhizobium]
MFKRLALVLGFLWMMPLNAGAAQLQMEKLSESIHLILVDGEFIEGDDTRFKNMAITAERAVVAFNSPGGLVQVGIEIGRTIAIKGFYTAVADQHVCASSCGLAWLAGHKRLLSPTSKIGFHAAFVNEAGRQDVSSAGNALVGSYLQQLNLNPNIIVYVTATGPSSMQWLTADDAERIGLDVKVLHLGDTAAGAPVPFGGAAEEQANLSVPESTVPQRSWLYFDYTDLPGYDLPGMPLKLETAAQCQSACQATDRCSAFTFNQIHSACFLKGMATEALQFSGAVSGYYGQTRDISRVGHDFGPSVAFRTSRNVEIVGKPFARIKNFSLAACQDQCVLTPSCQGFSFYRNGMCLMFEARNPTKANLTSVAGVHAD